VVRRRILDEPVSRLAIWSRRLALFALLAAVVGVLIVRSGALELLPALATLGGAVALALVAILLAFAAGVAIWIDGGSGLRQAGTALLIGFALIGYPIYLGVKAYRLPAIYDVTTDPIDPPRFDAIARLRPRDANSVTYAGLYAAELQRAAYSDIEPDETTSTPQEAYDAAMKVIARRRWSLVDFHPPQDAIPAAAGPRGSQAGAARDGVIEAVARTSILGFREDVVIRIRATSDGARIDIRSASRYGRHDLGSNAARVRDLVGDIDTILEAPTPERKPSPPPAKPAQAAGKGPPAKR
jgi:hypothetical protein